jgi:hypothetical protein
MTPQQRFARQYGLSRLAMSTLLALVNVAATQGVHVSNGEPHPEAKNRHDKSECAKLWEREVDNTAAKIASITKPYGFTGVVFPGLYPVLLRGTEMIQIPD